MEELNLFNQKTENNFYTKLNCEKCKGKFIKDAGDFLMELDQPQLCPKCNRIEVLQKTAHNFWNDPGHGWLEVDISDLKLLGIENKISGYSYRENGKAYLEEDCDAGIYIEALFPDQGDMKFIIFKNNYLKDEYREHIFIRSLNHYR